MGGHLGGTNGLADVLVIRIHARIIGIHADVEMAVGEEFADRLRDFTFVDGFRIQVDALMQTPPRACTVHGAGVEVGETVVFGQSLGSGRLADAGRPVNGYADHSPTSLERERTSVCESTR